MRAPGAHDHLGVDPGPGLSDVLLGAASLDQVAVPTSVPGVRLVGAGRPTQNPAALLARQQDFVSLARMLADFVLLDAPPLTVHDASELIWMVDAVVVTCRSGETTTRAAEPVPGAGDSDTIRRQLALPVRRVGGWIATAGLMVVMWLIIRAFLFQSFYIPSPSMAPALKPGDRVLVSKLSYRLHDVHRGDIV